MDETQFLFNSWKTRLELAKDRGFIVNENYLKITLKEFKFMLSSKESNVDIICNDHVDEPNKILYIKFMEPL